MSSDLPTFATSARKGAVSSERETRERSVAGVERPRIGAGDRPATSHRRHRLQEERREPYLW